MKLKRISIRTLYTLVAAFVLAAALAACGGGGGDDTSGGGGGGAASKPERGFSNASAVDIKNFAFNPDTITVAKGTQVTWTNSDNAPHTATASGTFDTGTLRNGASKAITLDKPGTYNYICTIHPSMKGTVTVTG
jgi:plastocyanin